MKVTSDKFSTFQPITLNISLESEEEAIAMYCVFNYRGITNGIRTLSQTFDCNAIRDNIGKLSIESHFNEFVEVVKNWK